MITAIEQALERCSADKFANISRLYLAYRFSIISSTGFVTGKEKSKKGTPDNFIADGDSYIFNEVTSIAKEKLIQKLKTDIKHCFSQSIIPAKNISKIILISNQKINLQIQKELTDYKNTLYPGTALEVIGVDAFATAIFRDYPSLGRELSLAIDTGQILETVDFITQYEKSKFATPLSNVFYNRKEELKEGIAILNRLDLLLITGPAGVGKTKFSIELVKNYIKKKKGYIVKFIRNNNQLIWDDLKVQILKNKKYVIVVDDANKLKSNLISIINFKNECKEGSVKIIFTVRNYHKKEIEKDLINYQRLELSNFTKKELAKILKAPEFNINDYYVDRIFSISKGNPRIAIMAAIAGLKKDIEKLHKASLILEEYFSSVKTSIKEDLILLKVAGILSLFKSIDISNAGQIDEINSYFGITGNELIEKLRLLEENELADEFKNIYKIADQILGEYIFYLIFIKEKHVSFALLLHLHFEEHKISLTPLLNPIISNYGFEEIKELIIYDLATKWEAIKNDSFKALIFLEKFWFYLQSETIVYLNKVITNSPLNKNQLPFKVYKDNHLEAYDDKIIDLLINFQNFTEKFYVALELLVKYGLSDQLLFTKILKAFKQSFTYKRFSYEQGYKIQIKLFEFLLSKVKKDPILYSRIILFIADEYLVDSFQYSEGGEGNKIYFGQYIIILSDDHKEFRENLFSFIFECYKNEALRDNVYEFFERHHYSHFHQREKKVISFDKNLIVPFFLKNFKGSSFRESSIINKYITLYNYTKIRYSKKLFYLNSSKEFKLWELLSKTGVEVEDEKRIIEQFQLYGLEEYLEFLEILNVIYINKANDFSGYTSINHMVSIILENLAFNNFNLFVPVLENILGYEYSQSILLGRLLSDLSYNEEKVEKLKNVFKKTNKEGLILDLFIRMPNEFTTIQDYDSVLNYLKRDNIVSISSIDQIINKLEYLDVNIEKEIEEILNLLIGKTSANNNLYIHSEFFEIINRKYPSIFHNHLDKFEHLYKYFDNQRKFFDYELTVLKILLTHNPHFITDLLHYNYGPKEYLSERDLDENNYKRLWELDNYVIVFDNILNYSTKFKKVFINTASKLTKIFNGNSQKEISFLKNKLVNTTDDNLIILIFNIVTTVYRNEMLKFLQIIIEKGCNIELFKKLELYTTSSVTMGSRLPKFQFELAQLEKVKQFLEDQNNVNYYDFIEYLDKEIIYAKLSIEKERKDEFTSEWN